MNRTIAPIIMARFPPAKEGFPTTTHCWYYYLFNTSFLDTGTSIGVCYYRYTRKSFFI